VAACAESGGGGSCPAPRGPAAVDAAEDRRDRGPRAPYPFGSHSAESGRSGGPCFGPWTAQKDEAGDWTRRPPASPRVISRGRVRYPPAQASCTSPAVIAAAVGDSWAWPPGAVPGFVVTATQPFCTLVPGCSGKVEPGGPASANADAAVAPHRARAHVVASRRRLIKDLPSRLREGVSAPEHLGLSRTGGWFCRKKTTRSAWTRRMNRVALCVTPLSCWFDVAAERARLG
jgi:hypothetical protein